MSNRRPLGGGGDHCLGIAASSLKSVVAYDLELLNPNPGYAKVVGSNTKKIIQTFDTFKATKKEFTIDLYGDNVGEKIYQSIYELIH